MDVDESVSLTKPKTATKPAPEPEEVSLTHKTPAEITPTVSSHDTKQFYITATHNYIIIKGNKTVKYNLQEGEEEAKLKIKKPEIVEEKTVKRPTPKEKDEPKV